MIESLKVLLSISISKAVLFAALTATTSLVNAELEHAAKQKSPYQKAVETLQHIPVETLSIASFPFCMGYTCREIKWVQVPAAAWQQATQLLSSKPDSAKMERALLTEVVSQVEVLVGRVTNTQYDIGGTFRANTLPRLQSAQLDCIDEAFNMHSFLHLLNNEDKLYWHRVGRLVHRGRLIDFAYPHTALSIIEKQTGKQFVIDSWFHDNGRPPELLAYPQWKAGWTPKNFK